MFLSRIYMFLTDWQNHSLTHSPIGLVHHYVVITLTSFFSSTPQMLQENWACLSTVIWSIFVLHCLAILKHTIFDFYTVPLLFNPSLKLHFSKLKSWFRPESSLNWYIMTTFPVLLRVTSTAKLFFAVKYLLICN